MSHSLERHLTRAGLVVPVRVDPSGVNGPTRGQARGPAWRRTSQGLYVPSSVVGDQVDQRIVEAAAVLPRFGGVTGWAGLGWLGGRWFDGLSSSGRPLDVDLATGGLHVRRQPGIAICEEKLDPRELITVDGLRVTTAVRSVCFAMRYAPSLREAVTVLEMAAYSDLVSIDELMAYALAHPAWTGIPQCREAVPWCDENVWSPAESGMKWTWTVVAGRPRPLCNRPVFDLAGRHLGTPDLLDPVAGVFGQYDGSLHLAGRQRATDLDKEAALRSVGLEGATMVAADRVNPSRFLFRLNLAYERAACLAEGERGWTIVAPPGWVSTETVAARRRLDDRQRARLLRYRAG
ncbi:MAG: hypothetical protein H6529_17125 [Nocardioides sp.]|nr:hypothetical protein [Nocardioidaceae bacterium]MCB8958187.1 hypothetical protein [Nocardioides sp.]